MTLSIRRIDCTSSDALAAIAELRRELSPKGNVVSPEGRARTIAAFGKPLTPVQVVERICTDVAARGLAAVLDYTRRLDGVTIEPATVRVSQAELQAAHESADAGYLQTLENVRANILAYQRAILNKDVGLEPTPGIELGVRYVPLRRVGVCIPGGAAAYPSTLLMTVVPAQAAGVTEIAVVAPPTKFGAYNTDLLAACHVLGVTEVYRIGGAQGVAALAYGVEGIPAVDKIVGPGNLFVALAKKQVYGEVDIDSIAGPSEVVLIADESANPRYLASDLISQAEHSPGVSILLTWEPALIDRVAAALEQQLGWLGRGDLARDSLARFGALILVRDEAEATRLSNLLAPEHLHISTSEPRRLLPALDKRRGDLPWPPHAGRRRRLCRRAVARAADRRHGAVGVGTVGERFPQTLQPDLGHRAKASPGWRRTFAGSPTSKGSRRIGSVWTSGCPNRNSFQVEDAMAGAGSKPPGDTVPPTSAARALEARRLHHRQMLRRGIITVFVLAIVGLLTAIVIPVSKQLRNSWILEAAGFSVNWQIDQNNWMSGGVTNVNYKKQSWLSGSHDQDLKVLTGTAQRAVSRSGGMRGLGARASVLGDLPRPCARGLDPALLISLWLDHGHRVERRLSGSAPEAGPAADSECFRGNRITDDGLAMISRISSLESLDLTATDVTERGPGSPAGTQESENSVAGRYPGHP